MGPWALLFQPPVLNVGVLRHLLTALTAIDVDYLRAHPTTPPLYKSGVVYQREPRGEEKWNSIPVALKLGWGDCEDLGCWRAAEQRLKGIRCEAFASYKENPNGLLYHIRVRYPDGRIEDPSRILGM